MRRTLIALASVAAAALATVGFTSEAKAGNYIVYLQGRSMKSWTPELASASGWTNVTLAYDGSKALNSDATNVTVKNAIGTYCSNGNNCIVHCYSAGCLRMVKAVSDLRAAGNTLPGLFWAEASGSAAGGSHLAELSTKGLTSILAKIFGLQEKIDYDITPGAARNTWGYTQSQMGATVYHIAGAKNICKKILFVKLCSGGYVGEGVNDGLVALHSSAGASSQGTYYDGCAVAKYPWRTYDSGYVACGGDGGRDHMGIVTRGSGIISSVFSSSSSDPNRSFTDSTTEASCNDSVGECDNAMSNPSTDFGAQQGAATVAGGASNAKPNTSGATCAGKCGGYSGANSLWCDSYCTGYGDCAPDFHQYCDGYNAN